MAPSEKESLALDVKDLRRRLGPIKVGLIEQWIREVNGPFDREIGKHVRSESLILDAGCSRGDPDLPSLKRGRFTLGCDVDLPGLRANNIADAVVMGGLSDLPFKDGSFDVIVLKWVLEHLRTPEVDFKECARVLRPGGVLVALTPNAHSLFTLISRSIPFRLKQLLKGNLFGIHEADTFRTWYRANSRRTLVRLAQDAGLAEELLFYLPGMWTFFIFSPIVVGAALARTVRGLEQLQAGVPGLRNCSTYLVGTWKKTSAAEGNKV